MKETEEIPMLYKLFGISLLWLCVANVQAQVQKNLNDSHESGLYLFLREPYLYLNFNTEQMVSLYGGLDYALFSSQAEQKLLAKNKVQYVKVKRANYPDISEGALYNQSGQILQKWSNIGDTTCWIYNSKSQLIKTKSQMANADTYIIDFYRENGYLHIKQISFMTRPSVTNHTYFNKDSIFYLDTAYAGYFTTVTKAEIKIKGKTKRLEISSGLHNKDAFHIAYNKYGQIEAAFHTGVFQTLVTANKYHYNDKQLLVRKELFSTDDYIQNAEIRFFYNKKQRLRKEQTQKLHFLPIQGNEILDTLNIISTAWYNKKGFCKREKYTWIKTDKTVYLTDKIKYRYNKKGLLLKKTTKRFVKRKRQKGETVSYEYSFFP